MGENLHRKYQNPAAVAKEAIWLLDQAQEHRSLSQAEVEFRARLKETYLGLLTMEKIRARQMARLTNITYGGVNSKLFYLRANGRKRKKHIWILQMEEGLTVKHEDKSKEIERHFREVLGTKQPRLVSINWDELNYPVFNLAELDEEITREEVNKVIASIPKKMYWAMMGL
jgi:hypothetical protein